MPATLRKPAVGGILMRFALLLLALVVLVGVASAEVATIGFNPCIIMDDIGVGGGEVNNYTMLTIFPSVNASWNLIGSNAQAGPYTVLDSRYNETMIGGTQFEYHIGNIQSFRYYWLYLLDGFTTGDVLNKTPGGGTTPWYELIGPNMNFTLNRRAPLVSAYNLTGNVVGNYTITLKENSDIITWYVFGTNKTDWLGDSAAITQLDTQTKVMVVDVPQTFEFATTYGYYTYIFYFSSGLTEAYKYRVNMKFGYGLGAPPVPPSNNPPNSTFTPLGEVAGCDPKAVIFTDTSGLPGGTPTAWNWTFRNTTGNDTEISFSTAQNTPGSFGTGNFTIVLNSSNVWGYNRSWQVTWINVSGACPSVAGGGITGVAMYGIDAPVDLGPLMLVAMATVIISAVRRRRRRGEV
jgi:hypothetical protein